MAPRNERDFLDNFESYTPLLTTLNDEIVRICDSIEGHFVAVGSSINEALRASPWLPDSIKPPQRAPARRASVRIPPGYFQRCKTWMLEHPAVVAAVIAFAGTSAFFIWRRRRVQRMKRRAKRTSRGFKTEAVVLVGSPYSSLLRSVAVDLARRGFVVYIPVSDLSEERLIKAEMPFDIRPLNLDITSPSSTANTLEKFTAFLSHPDPPHAHTLNFSALVLFPASPPPTAPISTLHPLTWSDIITTHLLTPFTILHVFLPLIFAHKPSLLFLTPSIIASLNLPQHGFENVTASAMHSYIQTLRKELAAQSINVVQFKMGIFDYGDEQVERSLVPRGYTEMLGEAAKQGDTGAARINSKGSSLRELHNSLFDVIVRGKASGGTVFVGRGSRVYELVSKWVPAGVVAWMLGIRKPQLWNEKVSKDENWG